MMEPVPDGGTPLHFASSMYKERVCDLSDNFYILTAAGKFKTVRWIVNNDMTGLVVFARDEIGDTPAHDAATAG